MESSDSLALLSHLINFVIVLYFVSFLVGKNLLNFTDLTISFIGLFASLISNIYSVIKRKGGKNE